VKRRQAPKRWRLRTTEPPELAFHGAVADLLDWILLTPAVWTTFPAGWGKLPPAIAGQLKRCGLKAGMPDILIFHHGRTTGLELKVRNNTPTSKQRTMHAQLWAAGVPVYVCTSVEEVIAALRAADLPFRTLQIQGAGSGEENKQSETRSSAA
jgi:hypothetical protein